MESSKYYFNANCSGEEIFISAKGEVSCQCKDGWIRSTRSDNMPVSGTQMSHGDCFQDITDSDYDDFEYDEDYDVVGRLPRSPADYTVVFGCMATSICNDCNGTYLKSCEKAKSGKGKDCTECTRKQVNQKCLQKCEKKFVPPIFG